MTRKCELKLLLSLLLLPGTVFANGQFQVPTTYEACLVQTFEDQLEIAEKDGEILSLNQELAAAEQLSRQRAQGHSDLAGYGSEVRQLTQAIARLSRHNSDPGKLKVLIGRLRTISREISGIASR